MFTKRLCSEQIPQACPQLLRRSRNTDTASITFRSHFLRCGFVAEVNGEGTVRKSSGCCRNWQHRFYKIWLSWRWLWKAQSGQTFFVKAVHVTHFPKLVLITPTLRLDWNTSLPIVEIHCIGHKNSFWSRTNWYAMIHWKCSEQLSCSGKVLHFKLWS